MTLKRLLAYQFSRAFALKDRDLAPFLVGRARRELSLGRKDLDALVWSRLKAIVRHAGEQSPFYARQFEARSVSADTLRSLDDFAQFPCLTRDHLRESLPELIAGGAVAPSWRRSATGGTTSSPVPFYCDRRALWRKNAFTLAMDEWFDRFVGDRVAYLWGAVQDLCPEPSLGMRLRDRLYKRTLMLPSAPLSEEIMQAHFDRLRAFAPVFLQAYPTPLYEFCLFLQKNRLALPSLRNVSVTAETLYAEQRRVIEATLGIRVYNWYGSRELARVASECGCHDGLHVNEPCVYVEIEADPSLPQGYGHLVITDLLNRATPLIRYRTGDLARFVDAPCACGSALRRIGAVEGRSVDVIHLADGRKIPGVSLTNRVIKDWQELREVQIVQKRVDLFLVNYAKGPRFAPAALDAFRDSLCALLDARVQVRFAEVPQVSREKSGKVRFVISELDAGSQAIQQEKGGSHSLSEGGDPL